MPRLAASLLGALAVAAGAQLAALPATQLAVSLCVCVVPLIGPPAVRLPKNVFACLKREMSEIWFKQREALTGRVASTLYVTLPVAVVSLFASQQSVAEYAAVDRLQKAVLMGLLPVTQVMQNWSPRTYEGDSALRMRRAVLASVAVGITAAALMLILGPRLLSTLFANEVAVRMWILAPLAGAVALVAVSRATDWYVLCRRAGFVS